MEKKKEQLIIQSIPHCLSDVVMAWECMIVNRIRSLVLTDDVPAERSNRKKSKVIPVTLCSG